MTKVNTVIYQNKHYLISTIGDKDYKIPEYGVIFKNGLTISCDYGYTHEAFYIGSMFFLSTHEDNELKKRIKLSTNERGELFLESDNLRLFLNLDKEVLDSKLLKYTAGKEPVVTYINAYGKKLIPTTILTEYAHNWVNLNKKHIFFFRILYYMITDEDFWLENEKVTWNQFFRNELGVTLPSIVNIKDVDYKTSYGQRYLVPKHIINIAGKKNSAIMNEIFELYPLIREMLEVEGYFGSLWSYNYLEDDLDYLLFKEDDYKTNISEFFTDFAQTSEGKIMIHDEYLNVKFNLDRKDLIDVFVRKDYVNITFKAPKKLSLTNRTYEKNEVVTGFVIDDKVKFKSL